MQQTIKFAMVPANKIIVAPNGPHLVEVTSTITKELNKRELGAYSKAIDKVVNKKKLNLLDLKIFDKVDEISMAAYGLCLKDSLVTKARLKACKRYKVIFNDRDGLLDHLRMIEGVVQTVDEEQEEQNMFDQFIEIVGYETAESFADAACKVRDGEILNIKDLEAISKIASCSSISLSSLLRDTKSKKAIQKACADYGLNVNDILGASKAFNNVH